MVIEKDLRFQTSLRFKDTYLYIVEDNSNSIFNSINLKDTNLLNLIDNFRISLDYYKLKRKRVYLVICDDYKRYGMDEKDIFEILEEIRKKEETYLLRIEYVFRLD